MNDKGFTLVELMAVFVVLSVLMGVTIANIVGITTANRQQTYAEDAKKFKNSVEYRFRGDSTILKPQNNGECIVANLKYVAGSEFDSPPYGGVYDMNRSYVIMAKKNDEYKYYVQLVERIEGEGYRGFRLDLVDNLQGEKYINEIDEFTDINKFKPDLSAIKSKTTPSAITAYYNELLGQFLDEDDNSRICSVVKSVYYDG